MNFTIKLDENNTTFPKNLVYGIGFDNNTTEINLSNYNNNILNTNLNNNNDLKQTIILNKIYAQFC